MLNYDTAVKATSTSLDSQNSAMREQEEYSKSLEARINRLKTEWTSFASTAGDAILYDGIVVVTEVLKDLTSGSNSVVSFFGALAPIFGIAGVAAYALSTSLRGMIATQIQAATATVATTGATGAMATAMVAGRTAVLAMGMALRGLLIASGVGAVLAGLGFIVEKLTKAYSANVQANEEFETYTRKNIEALTTNKEAVEDLISQYNALAKTRTEDGWDSKKEEEFLKAQQTLGEMYPALIAYTDSAGQAHLKTTEAIEAEVEATKELVKANNEATLDNAIASFDKLNKKMSGGSMPKWLDEYTNGSLEAKIKRMNDVIANREAAGLDTGEYKVKLLQLEKQVQDTADKIKGEMVSVANAVSGIDIDPAIQKNLEGFLRSLDVSNLNSAQLKSFSEDFGELQKQVQEAVTNGDKDLYAKTVKSINELAKSSKDADFKEFTTDYEKMVEAVNNGVIHVDGEGLDEVASSAEEADKIIKDLTSNIEHINGVLEDYAENNTLSASSMMDLIGKYPELIAHINDEAKMIQELEKIRDKDIELARKQLAKKIDDSREYYNTNLKMIESYFAEHFKFYNGDLKQFQTLAQAKADVESELIKSLADKWKVYYSTVTNDFMPSMDEWTKGSNSFAIPGVNFEESSETKEARERMNEANKELQKMKEKLDNFSLDQVNLDFSKIGTTLDKNTKATKSNNKELENSIYLADKYKQKLEELNLAIQKQIALRKGMNEFSDEYSKSLKIQAGLENEKLKAMQAQKDALEAQIKAGKIQQTGLVKQEGTVKTISKELGGIWSVGRNTSGFGMRTHPTPGTKKMHEGMDIAAPKGISLPSNVSGKVIKQGYNNVSGNYVKIEDSQGYKHFYGHLDKAFVKLGDMVEAGTQIGNIGSTGRSTGPHLHYQVQDALGKLIDPSAFVTSARNNKITTSSGGTSNKTATTIAAENAQSVDQAKSELIQLENDILAQLEAIKEVEANIRKAVFSGFENRRNQIDNQLSHEDAKLKNLDKSSERYNKTIEYQVSLMNKKQKVNEDEIKYLNELIAKGGIPAQEMSEYKNRVVELRTEIHSLNSALQEVVNTQLELFDTERDFTDNNIEYYNALLEELDTNSNSYIRTLGEISNSMKEKQKTNESELKFLEQNIKSGKYSGEVLENLKNRYEKLVTTMKSLSTELRKMNYDIVINIKVRADEKIDDLDFQLQRSKLIQGMYDEGSADFLRESDYQISKLKEMAELQKKLIADIQREMKNVDLLPEDVKRLNETLEDATIQLYQYQSEILNLQKSASESLKRKQEEIADKLINAYKDYLNEMKDAKLKSIDDEIEAENKRHNIAMKNLADEMDRFQRAIDEKRKTLDRGEAERGYNMEIDDLEKERNKLQDRINLLALDDSHGAKADKKKLEEQLAKIERDIAEKRHQRQLELQKQGLDDLLDLKEDEIEGKEELENKYHDEEMKLLDEKKKYYTQYYNDMLNNERKFAEIRKQILTGDFEALREEFGDYLDWLESTMPDLENTLDGTMSAVGTSIRQNIIDNLREALDLMNEIANTPEIDGSYGSSSDKDNAGENFPNRPPNEVPPSNNNAPDSGSGNSGNKGDGNYKNLTNADLEVLLGKFIREKIAPTAPAGKERDSVKYKGDQIAAKGRRGGSQILESESLSKAMSKLSSDDILKLSNFTTYNFAGIASDKYKNQILKWSNELRRQASLNGGGLLEFNGRGVDGIGGKQIIAHDGEVVSTPLEVDKIVSSTSTLERIMNMAMPLLNKLPNLPNLNLTTSNRGMGDVTIQLNGAIYNSNNRTAHDLVNEMADALKTQGRW